MTNTLHHNKSLWILAFFASLLFVSCLKDEDIQDIDIDFPEPVELKTVQLVGQVLDDEGMPAPGAQVEIVSHFLPLPLRTTTNEDGYYFFSEFTNRGEDVLLLIDHTDHFQGMYSQRILDEKNPVVATSQLSKTNQIISFSPENGTSVNIDNILQLDIEPNSFESHLGEIQLSAKVISNQDPANYVRGINGRGFLSSSIEFVNVSPQFTILIEFTDEFGGRPDLLKDAQFTLNVDNIDWLDNYKSIEAYHLQFSGFNYWLESGSIKVAGNEISGNFDKSGIWTIGGRVDKHLSVKGKLTTEDELMPVEGKVKMRTEDGLFMQLIRTGSNGAFQFDDVQPGRSFVLKFFNSCDERIHSYGPISLFESTDLGTISVQDVPTTELMIDARDCDDQLGGATLLRVTSGSGNSFFRLLGDDISRLTIPLCGEQQAKLSFLDAEGMTVFGPEVINLSEGKKKVLDPYDCFDTKLTVETSLLLLSSATGDTVNVWNYSMVNPDNRLILEVKTDAVDNLEGYRIKGGNDCFQFNLDLTIESGKISNVISQELEFFCLGFNYDKEDFKLGLTGGYPSSYDGGDFINQINIIDLRNEDTGERYDMLVEFRSSRD